MNNNELKIDSFDAEIVWQALSFAREHCYSMIRKKIITGSDEESPEIIVWRNRIIDFDKMIQKYNPNGKND